MYLANFLEWSDLEVIQTHPKHSRLQLLLQTRAQLLQNECLCLKKNEMSCTILSIITDSCSEKKSNKKTKKFTT